MKHLYNIYYYFFPVKKRLKGDDRFCLGVMPIYVPYDVKEPSNEKRDNIIKYTCK